MCTKQVSLYVTQYYKHGMVENLFEFTAHRFNVLDYTSRMQCRVPS
jgi:hypothetical protein